MATPKQVRRTYKKLAFHLNRLRGTIVEAERVKCLNGSGPYLETVWGKINEVSLQIDKEYAAPMAEAMRKEIKAEIK